MHTQLTLPIGIAYSHVRAEAAGQQGKQTYLPVANTAVTSSTIPWRRRRRRPDTATLLERK